MELTDLDELRGEVPQRKEGLDVRLWRGLQDGFLEAMSNVPREIVNHSTDGFEWGYLGSGPADLALNILYCFLDYPRAWTLHQAFKEDFLAGMPAEGGEIKKDLINNWIVEKMREIRLTG